MAGILGATPDTPRLHSPPLLAGAVSSKASTNSIPSFPLADADGRAPGNLSGSELCLEFVLSHLPFRLCPQFAEQIVVEDLEEAPASRPPPPAAVSLGLDDAGFEKDPRMMVCSQVGVHPNEAFGEPLIGRTDPGSEPGVALMDSEGSLSPGDKDDDPLHVVHHRAIFHQERQQASFVEVLRRGLVATGEGLLGVGAAPISIRSITDVDRMDALGITNCFEEVVGSLDFTSLVQTVLSLSQGGDLGPYSNLQQPDDSAAIVVPSASVRVNSVEGFVLKSILKKSSRTKQKRSHRSANHI
ncbi:hypothetical protein Nepgr_030581 [Nepenthes gracilis]|uniref:Uncharacterized protein n=1 Tax=Nepenthes gracilis TaxID=150966 RepID=A0AAD3Y4D9_NEPGR|nr:hypothetical protein Nepgr_030581 [Nepenthes gracilis]